MFEVQKVKESGFVILNDVSDLSFRRPHLCLIYLLYTRWLCIQYIYIYVNLHSASYISVFLIFSSTVCLEISISLLFMFFILNSSTSSPGSSHRSCLFHFASLKHIFIVFIFNSSPTSPGSSYRSCLFHSASF